MNYQEILTKELIICGDNRIAKDLVYVFDNLRIKAITSLKKQLNIKSLFGFDYINFEEAVWQVRSNDNLMIICESDRMACREKLQSEGLTEKYDYIFEDDFFRLFDDFEIPNDRHIAVWGIGKSANSFLDSVKNINIDFFIDSYSQIRTFNGKKVVRPTDIDNWDDLFVIVAMLDTHEVYDYLEKKGLKYKKQYVSSWDIIELPSNMLKKTIYDDNCYDLDCKTMMNHLEILRNGETMCCCSTFIEYNLGSVLDRGKDEIWKSLRHRIMCLSLVNKTYSFCNKKMCPLFIGKSKQRTAIDIDQPYCAIDDDPRVLALGYDKTCNLYCETCRDEICVAKGDEKEAVDNITEKIIREYLPNTEFLIMAGDGEVMLSNAYKKVYTSSMCKPKYIRLLSNGMLFDQKHWDEIRVGKNCPIMLTVSVDAATKETYEAIRRGSNFDILKRNMEFASYLRKNGELRYFRMNFVVQNRNYLEMPLFVEWGEELGVDEIFFTKVLNWGTWSSEEFSKISMMEEDGFTPKEDLRLILDDPRMKSHIVDLGTIRYLHKVDDVGMVDNYYKWELEKRGGKIFD